MRQGCGELVVEAPAKLNLTLDVNGRRPDGYHEMRSVMQAVDLADIVRLSFRRGNGIRLRLSDPALPTDSRNTAHKAAALFLQHTGLNHTGVDIAIDKHIPMQAGMAGGSADAAAVLVGLNALTGAGLDRGALCALGAEVGADVPFCVLGGAADATGIGTALRPLPPLPDCTILVVKPPVGVSTARAYALVDGAAVTRRPDADAMEAALERGSLAEVGRLLENVFEEAMALPEVAEIRETVAAFPAAGCRMTGSGSAVFALFEQATDAAACAERLRPRYPKSWLCRPVRTGARLLEHHKKEIET